MEYDLRVHCIILFRVCNKWAGYLLHFSGHTYFQSPELNFLDSNVFLFFLFRLAKAGKLAGFVGGGGE